MEELASNVKCMRSTLLNAAKSIKIRSIMNFKNLKFTCISSISQPACIRPGCVSTMALEFLHNKGNQACGYSRDIFGVGMSSV